MHRIGRPCQTLHATQDFFFLLFKQRIENMEGTRVKGALFMLELHPLLALQFNV